MTNVLVTGATGFIGKYVVDNLLQEKCFVIIAGRNKDLPERWLQNDHVKFEYLDFEDIDETINYFEILGRPDKLIHLAWQGLPNYKQLFHFEKNLPQQYSFLKNIIQNGLKAVTVTGTCFEYGMQQGCLSENMPAMPTNPYALAKHTLHCFLEEFKKHHSFQLNWIRLFYMYGKGQAASSLFTQLNNAIERQDTFFNMSGGEQERDFLPVETVVKNIVDIAMGNEETGLVNCCSGQPIKVKDWVEAYLKMKRSALELKLGYYPYADYEPMRFWGDASKLNAFLINEK